MADETIRRRSRGILWLTFVVVSLTALVCWPMIRKQRAKVEQVSAISCLRSMGIGLFEFEAAYGKLPDAESARRLNESGKTRWELAGGSSNAYLRQLVVAEIVPSEVVFSAKTPYTRRPDNRWSESDPAVAAGECGFGYVMNGGQGFRSRDVPGAIVACAPLQWDGRVVSRTRFDSSVYGGATALLRADNSLMAARIDASSGEAVFPDGRRLWNTGAGSVWGQGCTPVVMPPLPAP